MLIFAIKASYYAYKINHYHSQSNHFAIKNPSIPLNRTYQYFTTTEKAPLLPTTTRQRLHTTKEIPVGQTRASTREYWLSIKFARNTTHRNHPHPFTHRSYKKALYPYRRRDGFMVFGFSALHLFYLIFKKKPRRHFHVCVL